MTLVLQGERRRSFDPQWEITKQQNKLPDDPKADVYGKQGDIMLMCLRAYEKGRQDEASDWLEIVDEMSSAGRVGSAYDVQSSGEKEDE